MNAPLLTILIVIALIVGSAVTVNRQRRDGQEGL